MATFALWWLQATLLIHLAVFIHILNLVAEMGAKYFAFHGGLRSGVMFLVTRKWQGQ